MSNISSLRIDHPEATITTAIQQAVDSSRGRNITGRFLRGPIPLDWLQQAARLPGRALHLGIALWYLDGFQQTRTVQAKPSVIRDFGLDRYASYRALHQLEEVGLVSVVRKKGAAPMVTLLFQAFIHFPIG
jgi:hypothetical protein